MNIKIKLLSILLGFSIITIAGCSTYESYLETTYDYGKILEIKDKEMVIDFGHRERLRIGQIIDVYKTIKASPGFTRRYKVIIMGAIEITEILDDRHAKAKILYGDNIDKECRVAL